MHNRPVDSSLRERGKWREKQTTGAVSRRARPPKTSRSSPRSSLHTAPCTLHIVAISLSATPSTAQGAASMSAPTKRAPKAATSALITPPTLGRDRDRHPQNLHLQRL